MKSDWSLSFPHCGWLLTHPWGEAAGWPSWITAQPGLPTSPGGVRGRQGWGSDGRLDRFLLECRAGIILDSTFIGRYERHKALTERYFESVSQLI